MIQKGQKLHTRKIDIATYEGAEDSIVVEGILKDDRLTESYNQAGEIMPPRTLHQMIIRIEVKGSQLVIENIEVEMPTLPHDVCEETCKCLESVKGLKVVSGFSSKLKAIAGGTQGCNHLVALMAVMAPAVVQGAFSRLAQKSYAPQIGVTKAIKRFKNTCWAWRENGPLIEELKDLIK